MQAQKNSTLFPTRRLPATSCALPGAMTDRPTSVKARRKRIASARCSRTEPVREGPDLDVRLLDGAVVTIGSS
jgi:hypothetical protein